MSNMYLQKTNAIINEVLGFQEKTPSDTKKAKLFDSQVLEAFIKQFYAMVSSEDLENVTPAELYAIALENVSFFQQRHPGTPKIRIYNPTVGAFGWEDKEHTIIEVINDDMPFLVDSFTEELTRRGMKISRIIHPVMKVVRDGDGKLKALYAPDSQEKGAHQESVMHFQVSRIQEEQAMHRLQEDLLKILQAIRLAVTDWRKMLSEAEETTKELESATVPKTEDKQEAIDFLRWMRADNFVFLGSVAYSFQDNKGKDCLDVVPGSELGIFRLEDADLKPQGLKALAKEKLYFLKHANPLEITKSNRKSVIHRPVHMDYIGVKRYDASGKVIGERRFLGLFTSTVYFQSALHIPIIRKKIEYVVKNSGFSTSGHSGKALVAALEGFPRDELFQISEEELLETAIGIVTLAARPRVRLFVRKDPFERFASCIIFLPREHLSTQLREEMQNILCDAFHGTVANHYTQITDSHLARLHIIIKTEPGAVPEINTNTIEETLAKAASSWVDELRDLLVQRKGETEGDRLLHEYANAFTGGYSNRFNAETAYRDVELVEKVLHTNEIAFDLYTMEGDEDHVLQLKIYSPDIQLHLSDVMPMLENMGVNALDGQTLRVSPHAANRMVWLHHFRFSVNGRKDRPNLGEIKENFENALSKLWAGEIQDDGFNKLILSAGLNWRDVVLVRAYSKYLRQAGFTYSQEFIEEALVKHPDLTKNIVDLFKVRFDPSYKGSRKVEVLMIKETINRLLGEVENIAEDKVIRRFVELNLATLRTNYYQKDQDGHIKAYISFKLRSEEVPELPKPVPFAEIFVYSPRMEGIHLRGGKVARGGLRWSDRPEDFRTEILGLMKAQMTKNAVIVPVGSKGGFIVKRTPAEGGRDAWLQEGIECYKTLLRGLLDITDNVIGGKIVPPTDVVRYDEDDPYLVVAADKGTAAFSDIANSVSAEYNFWLGDAFASGGSAGYDHKKMGITARGAWVSVTRHFREMGMDTQAQDFTVIGIGDMSGDVFGNGMLLSPHICLLAAFDHRHIFIDPTPDAEKSFEERKRMFALPRSSWMDYDKSLISKGGGVFERTAKSIKLTPEMKTFLAIEANEMTPTELIRTLLTAKVDLLWNGGIGTYVKASTETNDVVGDRTNDILRVDGKDLRCKVVGEGGNLGFTQRGRIEYALKGGCINTDAIDNSAGVDCSDHEVNIKIALGKAVEQGKLPIKDRDVLLEQMTDAVAALVLRDNQLQTQAISVAHYQGHMALEMMQRLMQFLEAENLLDRKIEFLPDEESIARRGAQQLGLTRPEIAVLLAYSKMSIYNNLLASNLPDDAYFDGDLSRYFPEALHQKFRGEIEAHQLRREIIATFITNSMVNRVGCTFFHHIAEDTGMQGCDVARAYTIARDIFDLRSIWKEVEELDGKVPAEAQIKVFLEIQQLVEHATLWFLRNHPHPLNVAEIVRNFAPGIEELSKSLYGRLSSFGKQQFDMRKKRFLDLGIPTSLAEKAAGLESMAAACDIVHVARGTDLSVSVVAEVYFQLGARLNIAWLRSQVYKLPEDSYWQRLSRKTLIDGLFDQQRRLTAEAIKTFCQDDTCDLALDNWEKNNSKELSRYDGFIQDLKKGTENLTQPMILVAAKRIEGLCAV